MPYIAVMITVQQAYQQLLLRLYEIYDNREAANIAELIFEKITGFKRIERILNKQFVLSENQIKKFDSYTERLLQHEPVQYVLGEAWFAGMKLKVDKNVLIPRPETEELVEWVVQEVSNQPSAIRNLKSEIPNVLDVGTGSGCIAIALKKRLPQISMYAVDVSKETLNISNQNALQQQTDINFIELDILDKTQWQNLPSFDVIVSNPPYITEAEKKSMLQNVMMHEPHLALFVPDNDTLLFYKAIAAFGKQHLNKNGLLFFEINEAFGKEVADFLSNKGYINIELKKDMQGKNRMIKAWLLR